MNEREKWYPGKLLGRATKKGLLKQPTEETIHEISGFGGAKRAFDLGLLRKALEAQLPDEQKANSDYNRRADQADKAGLPDAASTLRNIAADEKRHHDTIAFTLLPEIRSEERRLGVTSY